MSRIANGPHVNLHYRTPNEFAEGPLDTD
jgi:hypothetical protein